MTSWQDVQRRVGVAADGVPGPATLAAIARALGMDGSAPMRASDECRSLIKTSEGFRAAAYRDSGGVWTIGWGHTAGVSEGQSVTQAQAEALLDSDIAQAEAAVRKLAPRATQGQFDALVDFVFNLGASALAGSTLLRLHNAGDHEGAAAEFGKWVHVGQTVLPGLVTRRAAEAKLYRGTA